MYKDTELMSVTFHFPWYVHEVNSNKWSNRRITLRKIIDHKVRITKSNFYDAHISSEVSRAAELQYCLS